jgi:hypothetical protein
MVKTRMTVVRSAIEVVLRRLDCLPLSDEASLVRGRLQDCTAEAERWSTSPPLDRARDELMRRVLAVHVEVVTLERHALEAGKELCSCG